MVTLMVDHNQVDKHYMCLSEEIERILSRKTFNPTFHLML